MKFSSLVHGKPYEQMDDLGVLYHYFWVDTHMFNGHIGAECWVLDFPSFFFPFSFFFFLDVSLVETEQQGMNSSFRLAHPEAYFHGFSKPVGHLPYLGRGKSLKILSDHGWKPSKAGTYQ